MNAEYAFGGECSMKIMYVYIYIYIHTFGRPHKRFGVRPIGIARDRFPNWGEVRISGHCTSLGWTCAQGRMV